MSELLAVLRPAGLAGDQDFATWISQHVDGPADGRLRTDVVVYGAFPPGSLIEKVVLYVAPAVTITGSASVSGQWLVWGDTGRCVVADPGSVPGTLLPSGDVTEAPYVPPRGWAVADFTTGLYVGAEVEFLADAGSTVELVASEIEVWVYGMPSPKIEAGVSAGVLAADCLCGDLIASCASGLAADCEHGDLTAVCSGGVLCADCDVEET